MLSLFDFLILAGIYFSNGDQANSSCYKYAYRQRNSAWGLNFWKNSPFPEGTSLKRWGNMYKNNDFIKDSQEPQDRIQMGRGQQARNKGI